MAISPLANVLRLPEPERAPLPDAADIVLDEAGADARMEDGALVTELADGAAVVDLNPKTGSQKAKSDKFDANLAEEMDESDLNTIASELLQGIEQDDQSRTEWLQTHAEGIKLLGLVVEDNSGSAGGDAAPLDGMSTARDPLLLEAVLLFQAIARGELLPAAGPVKVRDDRPDEPEMPEPEPGMGHNGGPALDGAPITMPGQIPAMPPAAALPPPPAPPPVPSMVPGLPMPTPGVPKEPDRDNLANALEKDFNHYLTVTAKEYVPDTDRMLFSVGFGGQGVKKVYNCPIRRRPVSESIAMEDFIVSNALTDLGNAARITHKIKMRPSILKRMQLLNAYRDTPVGEPTGSEQPNAVEQAKANVIGVTVQPVDPKDANFIVYECYCELDIDVFAPRQFKGKGLPLPYKVTIEKESEKVLEIRRNWKEDDEQAMAKEFFVEFPYDKAFGWYGIGLLHILGNLTKALTAALRITLDGGMFSNFPGFLYAKGAGRQLSNQFRVPPGGGIGLDVGLQKLSDAVMPLPYKETSPSFTAFIAQLRELGQRVGGTANTNVGEGRQDAPVGTTIALIEQAMKPVGAVLKRLHTAQSKELQLLKERFRDDPEAFWRFNRRPTRPWQKEQFIQALDDLDLVPVSDPNNPTKMHRAGKAQAVVQFDAGKPGFLDPKKVWAEFASGIELDDPDSYLAPPMPIQPPPVDQGKLATAQAKMKGDEIKAQTELSKAQMSAQEAAEAREGRIRELEMKIELEQLRAEAKLEAEQLKIAGQLAVAAEKADQADRHKALDLASTHHLTEGEREHKAELAREANRVKEKTAAAKRAAKPKAKKS